MLLPILRKVHEMGFVMVHSNHITTLFFADMHDWYKQPERRAEAKPSFLF